MDKSMVPLWQIQITCIAMGILFIVIIPGSGWALSVIKDIKVNNPSGIAINEINGNVYVLNRSTLTVIDGHTNEINGIMDLIFPSAIINNNLISKSGSPLAIMWNSNDQKLYVSMNSLYFTQDDRRFGFCGPVMDRPNLPCSIIVINGTTNKITNVIPVDGYDLQDMATNSYNDETLLVAGNCTFADVIGDCARQSRGAVITINDHENKSSILSYVGFSPKGIAVDSDNRVYVANQLSDDINVINGSSGKILSNITIQGGRPIEIIYNSFNHLIYITDGFKNSVDVINGTSNEVIRSIDMGDIPNGITFNPSNGNVYVTHSSKNSVDVINGTSNEVIENVVVGENPTYLAFNSKNNNLYVSNLFGNVTVLKSSF